MEMTLRRNQRDYYFQELEKHFPGLKQRYIQYYGNRYHCIVPDHKKLYSIFVEECKKYGILYRMKDIIKAYKKEIEEDEQIKLF